MIANLDLAHFKEVKQMPVITYEDPYFDLVLQFFNMLEKAHGILDYEDFELYAERLVMASFIMQRSYIRRIAKNRLPKHGILMRKKELFRKFIEEIVSSHTASREVLFYANELGVSCGYLNEVCNEVSTHSAKEIIDSAVASRLKYELSYTSKTIQELADEYSFPSQSYFSRYFKRLSGMTPSEFRKKRSGL
jgi:AraC-like DNA-binding protein